MQYSFTVKQEEISFFDLRSVQISKPKLVWEMVLLSDGVDVRHDHYSTKSAATKAGRDMVAKYQGFLDRMGYPFEKPFVLQYYKDRTCFRRIEDATREAKSLLRKAGASTAMVIRKNPKLWLIRGYDAAGDPIKGLDATIRRRTNKW